MQHPMVISTVIALSALVLTAAIPVQAGGDEAIYSKPLADNFPQRVFFGDTHVHSNNSPDSFAFGNLSQSPHLVYRYARGETMDAHNGMRVRMGRPMDFLVLSDHAEYLGVFSRIVSEDSTVVETELGGRWAEYYRAGNFAALSADFVASLNAEEPPRIPGAVRSDIWREVTENGDRYNEPGVFTAFNAYEWTSMPEGNNLHRVVIFKDASDKVSQVVPFSAQDSDDPEDLWRYFAEYEKATGGEVMSIAHNGNLSNGEMFAAVTLSGEPLDADYARRRMRWEPLYEVTQVKGDGEAHPYLSPEDPYADYETWDKNNIDRSVDKRPEMLQFEYARSALQWGLTHDQNIGANPFKFGLIGGTDIHTGFVDPDEANFFGKFPDSEPSKDRTQNRMGGVLWPNWRLAASGYAAIWAKENTRESLYEAMKRKETYATTGSRMTVRFFGGWTYESDDVLRSDMAAIGYRQGVPMGGELTNSGKDGAPRFMVAAAKDPEGANLERLQVVKGWLDKAGARKEKVFDVAVTSKPAPGDWKPLTGAGGRPEYSNTYGSPQLQTVWEDSEFDASLSAVYYIRVIEIPIPRWSAYDAAYYDLELDAEVPTITQERAYTSPIWYTPR